MNRLRERLEAGPPTAPAARRHTKKTTFPVKRACNKRKIDQSRGKSWNRRGSWPKPGSRPRETKRTNEGKERAIRAKSVCVCVCVFLFHFFKTKSSKKERTASPVARRPWLQTASTDVGRRTLRALYGVDGRRRGRGHVSVNEKRPTPARFRPCVREKAPLDRAVYDCYFIFHRRIETRSPSFIIVSCVCVWARGFFTYRKRRCRKRKKNETTKKMKKEEKKRTTMRRRFATDWKAKRRVETERQKFAPSNWSAALSMVFFSFEFDRTSLINRGSGGGGEEPSLLGNFVFQISPPF